jgi:hypothetical protein
LRTVSISVDEVQAAWRVLPAAPYGAAYYFYRSNAMANILDIVIAVLGTVIKETAKKNK